MTSISSSDEQQILELLAGQVLGDLSPTEQAELAAIDTSAYASALEDLEKTAAAAHLAFVDQTGIEEMPSSIRLIVRSGAEKVMQAGKSHTQPSAGSIGPSPTVQSSAEEVPSVQRKGTPISLRECLAWAACAASMLLAFGIWQSSQPETVQTLSLAAARDQLVEQAPDLMQIGWTPGSTPFDNPVAGDVVWSNARQEGFMRFEAMPANDPTVEQYQLWIIDPERDDEPIDGGVFNIPESGEVIVPIQAKLRVVKPAAFAVTIEKPGGVVVSDQSRLPLLAAVP
jgi:hypothetical protein